MRNIKDKAHGIHNFSVCIVIFPHIVIPSLLTSLEQCYIDSLKPKYNIRPTAESNAGHTFPIGQGKGKKMPEGFGDRKRKALGIPVYLMITMIYYYLFSMV